MADTKLDDINHQTLHALETVIEVDKYFSSLIQFLTM